MENKHFKISYQGVKDFLGGVVFFVLLFEIFKRYSWFIIDSKNYEPVFGGITGPIDFTILTILAVISVWLLHQISVGIVQLGYWFFMYYTTKSKWYPYLTEAKLNIPITKKQFWDIKSHPAFALKYPGENITSFDGKKMDKWAAKIIEKELNKLVKGGRQNEKRIHKK